MNALIAIGLFLSAWAWQGPHLAMPPVLRRKRGRRPLPPLDLAITCDLLAASFSSGLSIPGALVALGSSLEDAASARAFTFAGRALMLGASWEEAWQGCPADLRLVEQCLEPSWSEGVDPTALLVRAAASVREQRSRRAREAASRLASQLVVPLGVCFLPAFLALGVVPIVLSLIANFF